MKCPVDSVQLVMTERSGVEIDYCPQCRGVWLDRGELDKILDRAAGSMPASGAQEPVRPPAQAPGLTPPPLYSNYDMNPGERSYEQRRSGSHDYDRDHDRRRPKKKEGWLGDLFDF